MSSPWTIGAALLASMTLSYCEPRPGREPIKPSVARVVMADPHQVGLVARVDARRTNGG